MIQKVKIRDWIENKTSGRVPPPPTNPSKRYQDMNEEILINDMLKRIGLDREDLKHMKPSELKARIRDNKLDSIL